MVVMLCADLAAANEGFEELGTRHGERFACVEACLVAQNLYLWAAGAGLARCSWVASTSRRSRASLVLSSRAARRSWD
ncbi:hypothetical protein [Georgenia sp. H159]|uniref:hypothetical protein n=1 Tax=Georgenia sp. H159 TaxID=3076115 RepID=UPI002D790B60|nr:hypothetical protein [Georgenia sp. H159]